METAAETHQDIDMDASAWEDFIDVFYAPSAVFARHRDGRFVLALVFVTIVLSVLFYGMQQVLAPAFDAEFNRAMSGSANPQITAEQMQSMREMSGIFGLIGVIVILPVTALLSGLVLWGLGKLFGATATVAAAIAVATFSMFPRIIQSAVSIVQGLVMDPASLDSLAAVSVGPARFLEVATASPVVVALMSRLDIFIIWSVVLVAIGIHVVGNLPRSRAWAIAAVLWVLGCIPPVVGAMNSVGS